MKLSFSPELIHLYGPFSIQLYGLFIMFAIVITVYAIRFDKRFIQLKLESVYSTILLVSIIAGCVGARLLECISQFTTYDHWYDWLFFWQGGLSALGAILGIICITPLYLKKINVPILPTCDLVAIYAPLLQSIARLGCFTAGCCYGTPTTNLFSVMYTNSFSFAPHNIYLHPTQLYSSIILFFVFLFMYFISQNICKKDGQLFLTYLALAATERLLTDFFRGDRIMVTNFLSFHQVVSLAIMSIIAIVGTMIFLKKKK